MCLIKRRRFQGIILGGIIFFACFGMKRIYGMEQEEGVFIYGNTVAAGEPLTLRTAHVKASAVRSCTWYVGEQEVARARELISYVPAKEDVEHFIRVSVTLKDGTCYEDFVYFSVLPVMYMESSVPYGEVPKEEYVPVAMKLKGEEDRPGEELYEGEAFLHVRGNSTATLPKRPFKMKLAGRKNLLGLGESRHWTLLANAFDSTMLRNKLVYDFSGEIGAACQMHSQHVTLIYNGEYQGVYQLCEQVRIDRDSVDIYNWEDVAKEAAKGIAGELARKKLVTAEEEPVVELLLETELVSDFTWMGTHSFTFPCLERMNEAYGREIPTTCNLEEYLDFDSIPEGTGGVLLEMDFFHEDAELATNYALPFYFNNPEKGSTYRALDDYIGRYLQTLEYAFHETDFTYHEASPHYRVTNGGWFDWYGEFRWRDAQYEEVSFEAEEFDGAHYSQLMDMDSLLVNFLVCEYTVNWDGMKNSVYLYKDVEGPFSIGPAWDYDWAWGNGAFTIDTWAPDTWQTTNEYFASEEYYQSVQWNRYLIRDPWFLARACEKYREIRGTAIEEMIREGGSIDRYAEALKPAADANDAKWGGSMGNAQGQKFDEGIASLKSFLGQRVTWLDRQFSSVENLNASLGYCVTSPLLVLEPARYVPADEVTEVRVCSQVPGCTAVSFQVNGTRFYTAEVEDGAAVVRIPDSALREEAGALNVVQVRALDADGAYIVNPQGTIPGEYTNAVSNFLCF